VTVRKRNKVTVSRDVTVSRRNALRANDERRAHAGAPRAHGERVVTALHGREMPTVTESRGRRKRTRWRRLLGPLGCRDLSARGSLESISASTSPGSTSTFTTCLRNFRRLRTSPWCTRSHLPFAISSAFFGFVEVARRDQGPPWKRAKSRAKRSPRPGGSSGRRHGVLFRRSRDAVTAPLLVRCNIVTNFIQAAFALDFSRWRVLTQMVGLRAQPT
jgi:hypothetical protein